MCLEKPMKFKTSGTGYKVFVKIHRTWPASDIYRTPYNACSIDRFMGVTYRSINEGMDKELCYDAPMNIRQRFGNFYPAGYHIFASLKMARFYKYMLDEFMREEVVIVKVKYEDVRHTGIQSIDYPHQTMDYNILWEDHKARTVVAGEMTLVKEIK